MNYDEMSDFEVNKMLVGLLPFDWWYMDSTVYLDCDFTKVFDACNSWADIGPLIIEHGISLINDGSQSAAATDAYEFYEPHGNIIHECRCKDPSGLLRAAAICIIMKLEGERNEH